MKTVRVLVHCGAFLGAGFLAARADGGASSTAATPAKSSPPAAANPTGPWLMWSPPSQPASGEIPEWNGATGDGVGEGGSSNSDATDPQNAERIAEQTYQANQEKAEHPQQDNVQQIAQQQAYDDDWMLRGYTEQLKKHHLEKSDYTNPYLVSEPVDASKDVMSDDPMATPPEEKKHLHRPGATKSSFDDTSTLTPRKTLALSAFQPLLSPLNTTGTGAHSDDADSFAPIDSADGVASLLPVPGTTSGEISTSSTTNGSLPSSLLDVPGLTAASQGGLSPNSTVDFDDSGAKRPRPIDDFLIPTAPASDVTEFFRKQAASLAPPALPGSMMSVTPPPKPHPIVDEQPMAKPVISGIRTHIDDPFDILNR